MAFSPAYSQKRSACHISRVASFIVVTRRTIQICGRQKLLGEDSGVTSHTAPHCIYLVRWHSPAKAPHMQGPHGRRLFPVWREDFRLTRVPGPPERGKIANRIGVKPVAGGHQEAGTFLL